MCKLYYSITTNRATIIALFRVVNRYVGNLAPMPGVFPDYKDGLWYPGPMVEDGDARAHIIAKLLRSSEASDKRILEAEAGYKKVAKEFGLNVEGENTYGDGVLVIPRFDRLVTDKGLVSYGQESLVSALGVAEFAARGRHETYLKLIQEVSADPFEDTVEYVMRDMLNLAMGNPDNHGRNTAFRKFPDGAIRLSPLFDFCPMKIDASSIPRTTKWECMLSQNRNTDPDWRVVCEAVAAPGVPAADLMARLAAKERTRCAPFPISRGNTMCRIPW
jgi:serine/threonine-protein kinase HipA